jgi:hypothetical protein
MAVDMSCALPGPAGSELACRCVHHLSVLQATYGCWMLGGTHSALATMLQSHMCRPSALSFCFVLGYQQQNKTASKLARVNHDVLNHDILMHDVPAWLAVLLIFWCDGTVRGFQVAQAVPPSCNGTPSHWQRLPAGCSDLVTCLPGPCSPPSSELLAEARRLMAKGSYLAVAWNDRYGRTGQASETYTTYGRNSRAGKAMYCFA